MKINKILTVAVSTACLSYSLSSFSETYQFELRGLYSQTEYEDVTFSTGTIFEADVENFKNIETTYSLVAALKPIKLDKGPYNEAEFLSKVSTITFNSSKEIYEFDVRYKDPLFSSLSFRSKDDSKYYELSTNYIAAERFIIGASYEKAESSEDDGYSITLGSYLSDSSSLSLSYGIQEDNEDDDDRSTSSLDFALVQALNENYAFRLLVSADYIDSNFGTGENISIFTSYYFTPSFDIGILLGYIDFNDSDSFYRGLQSEYFFTSRASAVINFFSYDSDYEREAFSIGLRMRF